MHRTILRNGTIVSGSALRTADLSFTDGTIEEIAPSIDRTAHTEIDCTGMLIMPGMIDTHVHFREPGASHKGTVATETRAAIAGGVTTICDMPNTTPQTISIDAVRAKQDHYAQHSLCNYGIYIGATAENLSELQKADEDPTIPAIKIFMAESTGEMTLSDQKILEKIFTKTKKLIAVHAEDEARRLERLEAFAEDELEDADEVASDNPYQHALIRDNQTAALGTKRAVELALKTHHRTHILHMSAAEELPFLQEGMEKQLVTGETCPHYLFFDREDIRTYGGFRVMNPALKGKSDQNALWKALVKGPITQYATDHAPHLIAEKQQPYGSLPAGLPGIQFALPLLLHAVYQGYLTLERVVQLYAENPATTYRIERKGFLQPGYDADITIVDPSQVLHITDDLVESLCGWTPYARMQLRGGTVMKTFVNGTMVFDEGRFHQTKKGAAIAVSDMS